MRTIAIGRIVGLIVAAAGIAISAAFGWDSYLLDREFRRWFLDWPMEAAVDLSRPGEIEVPVRQTCSISHGEGIYLRLTPELEAGQDPAERLATLSARLVVKDRAGSVTAESAIDKSTVRRWEGTPDIMLVCFRPFSKGDYLATLRVNKGVASLAGRKQTVYAKYHLCGLEHFPAVILGSVSFAAGGVGLVAALCVLPGLWRCGLRRERPASGMRPEC